MSKALEWLIDDLKRQPNIAGILLSAMREHSLNVVVVLRRRRDYYRRGRVVGKMWVDEYFNTYKRIMDAIVRKEEAHTYVFNNGKVLYDPEGYMSILTEFASHAVRKCGECEKRSHKALERWQGIFRSLVKYRKVPNVKIREHMITLMQKEWEYSPQYLTKAKWTARRVNLNELTLDLGVMSSVLFMKEIGRRVKTQQMRILKGMPIEPIVAIENKRLWLIDGYARIYALTRLGLDESVTYVGRIKGFAGP